MILYQQTVARPRSGPACARAAQHAHLDRLNIWTPYMFTLPFGRYFAFVPIATT